MDNEKSAVLIVVTGRPAAGKSAFARKLSIELDIPVVSKDEIREVLFDRLGWGERSWAQKLGLVSIDLMFHFAEKELNAGRSIIMDNAFRPDVTQPQIENLLQATGAKFIQIVLDADSETLHKRFTERANQGGRHPGHGDDMVTQKLQEVLNQNISPLIDLDGMLIEVDTTDFAAVDFDKIIRRLSGLR